MAFWDTSAIVPLCCSQPATARCKSLFREDPRLVAWWGAPVEARSALARLRREGRLTAAGRATAVGLLARLRVSWDEILPSERVRALAEDLPDEYAVRAADALQLAAALVWCREKPRRRAVVCFDDQLAKAAAAVGFTVRS